MLAAAALRRRTHGELSIVASLVGLTVEVPDVVRVARRVTRGVKRGGDLGRQTRANEAAAA